MERLMKLIEKRKSEGKEMDPMVKDSKMSMLKALRDEMSGLMKNDLSAPHKVEVAANDEEGLKLGLDKAKEVLGEDEDSEEPEISMLGKEPSMMDDDSEGGLSEEEQAMLEKLLAKSKMQRM